MSQPHLPLLDQITHGGRVIAAFDITEPASEHHVLDVTGTAMRKRDEMISGRLINSLARGQ